MACNSCNVGMLLLSQIHQTEYTTVIFHVTITEICFLFPDFHLLKMKEMLLYATRSTRALLDIWTIFT
jgi:hypothetical protein